MTRSIRLVLVGAMIASDVKLTITRNAMIVAVVTGSKTYIK